MIDSEKNRDVEENEYLDSEPNDGFEFEEFNKEKESEDENIILNLTLDKKNKKFKIEDINKTQKIERLLEKQKFEDIQKNQNSFKNINFPTKNNPKKVKKKNLYLFQNIKKENKHENLFKEKIPISEDKRQTIKILHKIKNKVSFNDQIDKELENKKIIKNEINEENKLLRYKLKELNDINNILQKELEKMSLKLEKSIKNKILNKDQKREFLELEEKYLNLKKDHLECEKKEKFEIDKKNEGFVKDLEDIQKQYENAFNEVKNKLENEKENLILENKKLSQKNNNFVKDNEVLNKKVINLQIEKKKLKDLLLSKELKKDKEDIIQIKNNYETIIKSLEYNLEKEKEKLLDVENLNERNNKLEFQLNNQNNINEELKRNLDDLENELETMINNDSKTKEIIDKNQILFKQQKSVFNEIFKISLKTNRIKSYLNTKKENKIFKSSKKKDKNLYNSILNQFKGVSSNIEELELVIKNMKEEIFDFKKDLEIKNDLINRNEENSKIIENEFEQITEENKILKDNLNELTDQLNEQIERMEELEEKENLRLENEERFNLKDKNKEKEKIKSLEERLKEFETLNKKHKSTIYRLKKFVIDDTVGYLIENWVQLEIGIKELEEKQVNLQIKMTDQVFQNESMKSFEKNFSGTHFTEENNDDYDIDFKKEIDEVGDLIKLKEQKKLDLESKIIKFEQNQKNKLKTYNQLEKDLQDTKKLLKNFQNQNNFNASFTSEKFKMTQARPRSSYQRERSVKNYSVYKETNNKKWPSKFQSQKFTPLNSNMIEYNVLKGKLEKLRDKYNNI